MNFIKYNQPKFENKILQTIDSGREVNVVLSGGGEKGIAHVAFLEKIERSGLKIKAISGTSAGSLVGAMYCSGVPLEEIKDFFINTRLFQYSMINLSPGGLFKLEKYSDFIKDMIKPTFEDLDIPLYVCATNLQDNASHYFYMGELLKPVLASCAVPGFFTPININQKLYADGGIMDNFPIYPFFDQNIPIIGSFLGKMQTKNESDLKSLISVSRHSAELLSFSAEKYKFNFTKYTAIYPLEKFSPIDSDKSEEMYAIAKRFLEE